MGTFAHVDRGFVAQDVRRLGSACGRIWGKTKGQVASTNLTLLATISSKPKGA